METWQDTAIKMVIGLLGAGVGGIATHLWKRRRMSDKELFLVLRGAFDRPAFKGPYSWQTLPMPFQEAIRITMKAVKTGRRSDRHGQELELAEGRHLGTFLIRDPARRKAVEEVEDLLQRILNNSMEIKKLQKSDPSDPTLRVIAERIDRDRDEIIRKMNLFWKGLGIREMRIPTSIKDIAEAIDPPA